MSWIKRLVAAVIVIIPIVDYSGKVWGSKVFTGQSALNDLILFFAFLSASYYAFVTYKMWQLNKQPMLRLQFNDLGRDGYFKQLKIDRVFLYNTYTDLQLVNDGNGGAIDLDIQAGSLCGKELPKLRNVTAIGPNGKTQLRYGDWGKGSNRSREFNDEDRSYAEPYQLIISYSDMQGKKDKIKFKIDEGYNDGFKIIN